MEMNLKLVKAKNADPLGEQEGLVRENLIQILQKFGLQKMFQPEGAEVNDVLKKNPLPVANFDQVKIHDKRLKNIWTKAQNMGFSGILSS